MILRKNQNEFKESVGEERLTFHEIYSLDKELVRKSRSQPTSDLTDPYVRLSRQSTNTRLLRESNEHLIQSIVYMHNLSGKYPEVLPYESLIFSSDEASQYPKISHPEAKEIYRTHELFAYVALLFKYNSTNNVIFINYLEESVLPTYHTSGITRAIYEGLIKGESPGFPVQGITIQLLDAMWHEIDSSPRSFFRVAMTAFKNAFSANQH